MRAPIAFAIGCIFTTLFTDSVSAVHCNKQHTVANGDTCKSIAKTYNISEKVIDKLNPSVNSVCDHLEDGLKLCVGSSIKSLNKASPKTVHSKKAVHTKQKATTLIKGKKSSKKHSVKHTSKKHTKKVSAKKASKSSDAATSSAKAKNVEPTDDTTAPASDASSDDSAAEPTDASSDDSSAEPTDDGSDASSDDSSSDASSTDDSSAQPTDDGSDASSDDGGDDASNGNSSAGPQVPSDNGSSSNSTQAPALNYFDTLTVQLTSADDFCLLLPSSPGGKKDNNNKIDVEAISKSEGSAVSFCLKKSSKMAPKAREMPEGLIKSAYFYKNVTGDYSQVSGRINPKAYMLSEKDYGGQYDNHGKGAPANSMCYGYKYLVELIEPNTNDFCIRCCNVYEDCNAGRSAYGCQRVVSNGRYS